MHMRVQSWLPFTIQIYVNGHEWLCRQLDRRGIGYQRYDNALLSIDDPGTAAHLCRRFINPSPRLNESFISIERYPLESRLLEYRSRIRPVGGIRRSSRRIWRRQTRSR